MTRTGSKGGAMFVRLMQEQFGCALLLLRAAEADGCGYATPAWATV